MYAHELYAKENLPLLGKTLNQYHAKCMHFSKMQFVSNALNRFCMSQYPGFIQAKTQPYIFPIVGFFCFFFASYRN